jgi:thiosulfate dehydrogenase [quinone] large subunit
LLPLRAFIGVTFLFAGLQKLSNPNFFDANSPSSIQAQLIAAERLSPIHFLIGHLLQFATPLGIVISLGEIAVGIGMLLGLWTRIAAIGGAALAFMLFLTVSFHASPYYTGADIVFFFAFMPFIVAGAGGVLSLDARIARRAATEQGLGDPTPYVMTFAGIQETCGNFDKGRCTAQKSAPCGPVACPVLSAGHPSILARGGKPDEVDRRTVVIGSAAAAAAGVVGAVAAVSTAGIGRAVGGSPKAKSATNSLSGGTTTTTAASTGGATTTTGATPKGRAIGAAATVPVGGAATFTAANGDPGIVLQPSKGQFLAYDAICPHAGCTVAFSKAADLMVCPCHGSEFKVSNGDVVAGPAPTGLTKWTIAEGGDGQLYVQD